MDQLRSEIKHNFLKKIIFRLDYEGLMDTDIEKCIVLLREKIFASGFVHMENRIENQIDFQMKVDLNIPDENQFSVSNTNKNMIYSFSSDKGELLEISKSVLSLIVDIDMTYETFDKYMELLAESIDKIKQCSLYFRTVRIGLRKINICLLENLAELSTYFTRAAFNINDIVEIYNDYECVASNMSTILSKNNYQINYVRNIQEGVMQQEDGSQKTMYQIVLDIDVNKEGNKEISSMLCNRERIVETLNMQNKIAFEVFAKSLSGKSIEALKQEKFSERTIIGVI